MPSLPSRAAAHPSTSECWLSESASLGLQSVAEFRADHVAELKHHFIGDRVIGAGPNLTPFDQAHVLKDLEMFAYIGLGRTHAPGERRDTKLTILQNLKNPQPDRLAERAKTLGDEFESVPARFMRFVPSAIGGSCIHSFITL